MPDAALRSLKVAGPAVARLFRARLCLCAVQVLMLTSWGLLLPLLLVLPFGGMLPPRAGDAVGYLMAGCLLGGFLLCIPEAYFRRRRESAQQDAFGDVQSALGRLRAGWNLEWESPYAGAGPERLISFGSWNERFEWRVSYRRGALLLTEIPAGEHEVDEE
ncbi:hypothetical protein [Arthrobacter luteolus]|uniref:hypothetical protein n=1 Tax=Arthrobacter luteolus TaxID=98672 RepID=UPI00384DB54D